QLESNQLTAYVARNVYESQNQALELFQEQYSNLDMADSVSAEQLPESFRVSLVNPEQYEVVNEMFSGMAGVEVVSDQRELLESLFSLMNSASVIAIALAVIMLITAILLFATTIRLSAF